MSKPHPPLTTARIVADVNVLHPIVVHTDSARPARELPVNAAGIALQVYRLPEGVKGQPTSPCDVGMASRGYDSAAAHSHDLAGFDGKGGNDTGERDGRCTGTAGDPGDIITASESIASDARLCGGCEQDKRGRYGDE